jgi:hypothetical protein
MCTGVFEVAFVDAVEEVAAAPLPETAYPKWPILGEGSYREGGRRKSQALRSQ